MQPTNLDITEARNQFNRLDERLREEKVVRITRHGRPVFAVVDHEYLAAILETIEVMADPEAHRLLLESLDDIRAGRLHDHEAVKRELLDD